jgi:Domain of unknown function (DUF4331)
LPVPPPNIGPRSTPNYAGLGGGVQQLPGNVRVFAGQRDEGFYVDLGAFDDRYSGTNQPAAVRAAEMLRFNVAVPPSMRPDLLGVLRGDAAGFPNARRVGDDVLDIVLQAAAGATPLTPAFNRSPNNTLGDGVSRNVVAYLPQFPYLAFRTREIGSRRRPAMRRWFCVRSLSLHS